MAIGQEILVNTTTYTTQRNPKITTLSDGGYVIVWESWTQDGEDYGIFGQRFAADGTTLGSEFQVNTTVDDKQEDASVAGLADGGFIVTWTSTNLFSGRLDVFAQRYDLNGAAVGGEFQANTYTTSHQFESIVTALDGGGYLITWTSLYQDGRGYGVFAQRYNADGSTDGSEFQVNSTIESSQNVVGATALSDGGVVLWWYGYGPDDSIDVMLQKYDAAGLAVGGESVVETPNFFANRSHEVAALSNGGFVMVWQAQKDSGNSPEIRARQYAADGSVVGKAFTVNTHTDDTQSEPHVAALSTGGYVVVWQSRFQDGSGYGIFAQRFNPDRTPDGGEFQVNSFTQSDQSNPAVTSLANGDFVVSWTSSGVDGSSAGIASKTFSEAVDPTGNIKMSGLEEVGQTLTADASKLKDVYGLGTFTYQWMRDGVAIAGADQATFDITEADAGANLKVKVSYVSRAFYDEMVTSNVSKIADYAGGIFPGTPGDDTLTGTADKDLILGEAGNDVLIGLGGKDLLIGATGQDKLRGGRNRDTINGGEDDDRLTGGGGLDTFVFAAGDGHDTLVDFQDTKDILRIDTPGLTFADVTVTQTGADVLVSFLDVQITLLTETAANITDADFQFL